MTRRRCKLSSYKQSRLLEMYVAGVTARTAGELLKINRHSATLFYHKIREMISYELVDSCHVFGEIEVDESYFGGHRKGNRGRAISNKIPVFGLLKRGGKVYTKIIPDASSGSLIPIIQEKVIPDSIVYSDCWNQAKRHLRKYNGVPKEHFHLFLKECEFRFNFGSPAQQLKTLKCWKIKHLI